MQRPQNEPEQAPGEESSRPRPYLVFDRVNKFFGSQHVLRDLSFSVERGEILALLGPSGSGKTTALRLLAGFEHPEVGRIEVDGEDVQNLPPAKRGFGMVFQSYALFPHLSVAENVAFGLEAVGWTRRAASDRVADLLRLVNLEGFEQRRIGEISGGQQQRVALARALAPEPRVLMLDEPLSNLDPALRERTRRALRDILSRTGTTTVLVTHEQEEAFEVGDRVGVLNQGRLEQLATPEVLYDTPATPFLASFVGRTSTLQGIVEEIRDDTCRVRLLGVGSETGVADWWAASDASVVRGEAVKIVARPEGLRLGEPDEQGGVEGVVVDRRFTGPLTYYTVALELGEMIELLAPPHAATKGDRVVVVPRVRPLPRVFAREREE